MAHRVLLFLAPAAAAALTACAGAETSNRPLPAWFVERQAELNNEGYPDLANVPDRIDANTRQPYWDGVTAELDAAAAAMRANPRSGAPADAAAQAADAETFDAEARQALEATRSQH